MFEHEHAVAACAVRALSKLTGFVILEIRDDDDGGIIVLSAKKVVEARETIKAILASGWFDDGFVP